MIGLQSEIHKFVNQHTDSKPEVNDLCAPFTVTPTGSARAKGLFRDADSVLLIMDGHRVRSTSRTYLRVL